MITLTADKRMLALLAQAKELAESAMPTETYSVFSHHSHCLTHRNMRRPLRKLIPRKSKSGKGGNSSDADQSGIGQGEVGWEDLMKYTVVGISRGRRTRRNMVTCPNRRP